VSTTTDPTPSVTTPAPATAADLARRFVAAMNAGDLAALDDILDPAIVDHHLPPGIPAGIAGVKLWCALLGEALDLHVEIEDVVEAGDRVAVRARITGTHVGEFGGMPATGRRFDASFMSIERAEGGRLVERWEIPDNATVMAQLTGES
jgi:predicted ester cyclase